MIILLIYIAIFVAAMIGYKLISWIPDQEG